MGSVCALIASDRACRLNKLQSVSKYRARPEKGEGPVKLETLERIAELLDTSLPSIFGVGTEYFSSAIAYFERLRQIEAASERVLVYYEPVTFLLTSDEYPKLLRDMLMEGLPEQLPNRKKAQAEIESLISILSERRTTISRGGPSFAGIIGATQVRRLLRTGLIGTYDLPKGRARNGGGWRRAGKSNGSPSSWRTNRSEFKSVSLTTRFPTRPSKYADRATARCWLP